ncbi:unnamed protein product [Owenia fusiformis]|uniref:Uncharacterized protein n=1 Tax=Owenia fusiformis TaxID=6347 RepID=A0A8J1UET9_OWEFU|nr:unnamed protein product [Owenia fusiformis]
MAKLVVLAIDNSTQAEIAFDWYVEHIYRPEHQLLLLHCGEVRAPTMPSRDADGWKSALEEVEGKVNALRSKYETKMKNAKITGTVESDFGKPGELIVKVAEERSATMIVMGSRGFGTLRRTILGSVSDYVLHHSKQPVIICPKK